jgi:hypothetical protein
MTTYFFIRMAAVYCLKILRGFLVDSTRDRKYTDLAADEGCDLEKPFIESRLFVRLLGAGLKTIPRG